MTELPPAPFLIVLSAPSGGGKTTIALELLNKREDLSYSISATTRAPRHGEVDGRDYYFLARADFERRRDQGDFLEWAEYSGQLYGTLQEEVDRILDDGLSVLLDIEVQGARLLRKRREDVVSIFILPPSAEALKDRLGGRSSDSEEQMSRRLRRAIYELDDADTYDFVVINDDLDRTVAEVNAIIDGKEDAEPHRGDLERLITTLRDDLSRLSAQAPEH